MIVLLSVAITLLAVNVLKSPSPAVGQSSSGTASSGTEIVGATGSTMSGSGSAFYLYDNSSRHLVVYFLGNSGLELRAARDLTYDLQIPDFNGRAGLRPTVKDIQKEVIKQQRAKTSSTPSRR